MRRCACGAPATSWRNICGIRTPRCAACAVEAARQHQADIAAAIAIGNTWLLHGEAQHDDDAAPRLTVRLVGRYEQELMFDEAT